MIDDGSFGRYRLAGRVESDRVGGRRDFPSWHFAMLNDRERNAAIEGVIAALDLKGKIVFEIGAGSGIVALLFAKHGAEHVYTCETHTNLAELAGEIIAISPHRHRVTLIPASSRQVVERRLLPRTPDIIFTETVDCGVVGEGFFAIRADIQKLAGPETLILPNQIEQSGTVIESGLIRGLNEVGHVSGFDLSPLNRFSTPTYYPVRASLYNPKFLSEPCLVRTYDYSRDIDNLSSIVRIMRPGTAHGLLSWFTLHFGGHSVSNAYPLHTHWHQAFHPFAEALPVQTGHAFHLRLDDSGVATIKRL